METIRAINHELFDYLRNDSELASIMGNTNIREGLATRSEDYPYIVFSISPTILVDTPVIANCDLQIDIWDKADNGSTEKIYETKGRLIKLLDCKTLSLDGGEVKGARIFLDSTSEVLRDPDEEFVLHVATLWTLRFVRSEDLVY
jgi:hypothetical protein